MIGVAHRILDSMLLHIGLEVDSQSSGDPHGRGKPFVNSRPLVPVSSDLETPLILTPQCDTSFAL